MSFELLAFWGTIATGVITAVVLWVALSGRREVVASASLDSGSFVDALDAADTGAEAERGSLYAAAVAARHLLEFERSEELLHRMLEDDDGDGEAWLELGLVELYRGDAEAALPAFDRAASSRSDLLESLTLHRALAHLRAGRVDRARFVFEEVEAPLETKLRTDMGAGEPMFAEWFLQCSELWRAFGKTEKADWARREGLRSCGDSRLGEVTR